MAKPINVRTTPTTNAIRATPNATTDVNSDACRNAESIAVARFGSSLASSEYVWPPVIPIVCLLITIAWQFAVNGPFTSSPARQSASCDTVIFWSDSVFPITT